MRHQILTSLLTVLILITATISTRAQKGEQHPVAADPFNSRLAVQVASNGRFNMGAFPNPATGGATQGSFNLIYSWPASPGTSFSTIRIDGTDSVFGSSGTLIEAPADIDSKTNRSKWQIGDIEVTQVLQLVLNNQTGQEDIARMAYTVRNTGSSSHSVGMRIMIDTMLNNNDGAPFRVPGVGIVTNEAEFFGSAIPDTFQAFFNITDGEHIAAATTKSGGATPPDRLVLARWPGIVNTLYDYTINSNASFTDDSAYGLYWNSTTLSPGQSRTYVSFYGLSNLQVDLQPPLALGVTGPTTLSVVNSQYSPNPFDVVATILNNGTAVATNVQISINPSPGLSLASGNATAFVGDLGIGQERQVSWQLLAAPQNSDTTLNYSITAVASNAEPKTVPRQVFLPALSSGLVPVIFIPGIMGSEIGYDQGSSFVRLWPDVFHFGDSVQDLRKRPDGSEIDVNKHARDIVRSVVGTDVYRGFIQHMASEGFQEGTPVFGTHLFVFAFDWRDSIRNSAYLRDQSFDPARNLKDKIAQVLNQTGANEVDIVAHSMGGLVALEYLRDCVQNNRSHHIRKLVTVATPYLGSPSAFQALRYGKPFEGLGRLILVDTFESKRIAHNLPGTYQLLPSRKYFDPEALGPYGSGRYILDPNDSDGNGNTNPFTYDLTRNFLDHAIERFNKLRNEDYQNSANPTLNTVLTADAETLHGPLDDFARRIPSSVALYTISGWGQLTNRLYEDRVEQKLGFDALGQLTLVPYVRTIADQAGDKTVPLWSSSWPNSPNKYFIKLPRGVEHAFLLKDACVQNLIVGILKNQSTNCASQYMLSNTQPTRDALSGPQWSVEVFSPATLHLFDSQGLHTGSLLQGGFEEAVSQSSYETVSENGFEQLSFVTANGLVLRIDGTGTGTFDLKIYETVGEDTIRTLIYRNVSVNEHTKGYIQPDFGAQFPVLKLDANGDGSIDEEILPTQSFTGSDPIEVAVDIQPGSNENPLNVKRPGILPLAILSTQLFNAATIDPLSVQFGKGSATEAHHMGHLEDVNGDGRPDMVLHFRVPDAGIQLGDRTVCLVGSTTTGNPFQGCDRVTVIR